MAGQGHGVLPLPLFFCFLCNHHEALLTNTCYIYKGKLSPVYLGKIENTQASLKDTNTVDNRDTHDTLHPQKTGEFLFESCRHVSAEHHGPFARCSPNSMKGDSLPGN